MCNHIFADSTRERFKRRGNFQCVYCLDDLTKQPERQSLDHVIPQHKGGSNQPNNVVLCCISCNSRKNGKSLKQFGYYMEIKIHGYDRLAMHRRVRNQLRRKMPVLEQGWND